MSTLAPRTAGRPGLAVDRPAAARADSPRALLAFQRTLKDAIIRPLGPGARTQRRWVDGRPMAEFAAGFIKPNDRLTALDRLEIYNRVYWFRLLDSFYDDTPGLRAALGERGFKRLAEAYLVAYPSRTHTLRNLCDRLPQFIRERPELTAPRTALALDIARFEWAQTVAFDGGQRPVFAPAELAAVRPARLRLGLQPYVTLLDLRYPVDDYVIAVKRRDALRGEASHVATGGPRAAGAKRVVRPAPARTRLAVHRLNGGLFYKRLEPGAFRVLAALRDGVPLARALSAAGRAANPAAVRDWFATWMELGWLCHR